ncbi:YccF domain-containing protein [Luteibacter yeojuensis]|uniref:Inner membrane protein YccF n=1 Tax=Luteibacter yeojuensis TaxID=345309 RepID=A0A7X5TPS0_9GAMM|nr:YccF domain-containing protein [Luteibacter yeojuensis]NID15093.1 YccF domain-containing protein [Luteibacter yeojuensis]
MRTIMNLLWFVFGGLVMGLGWWLAGLVAMITIVGIPWARSCFVIGTFAFFPFGKEAVDREQLSGRGDIGTSAFGTLGNIIWFVFAGIWLAIGHVCSAIACCVTIIGIPFGIQHLKLAGIALAPIGKTVVSCDVAAASRRFDAEATVQRMRGAA